jgi:hypothetical protein
VLYVFALLDTPVHIRSHQDDLPELFDQLRALSFSFPLLTEMLDFFELFEIKLPLLLKGLIFLLILPL